MDDAEIKQRFHLMQKELEVTASLMKQSKLDLLAAIDSLRIELEALKLYMHRSHADFRSLFRKSGKK
jgi:hypothetical protein